MKTSKDWHDMQSQWLDEVDRFMEAAKESCGIDYKNDDGMRGALDNLLKDIAGDPSNAAQPSAWLLWEAHRRLLTAPPPPSCASPR